MSAGKKSGFQIDTGGVNAMLSGLSGRFASGPADQPPADGTTADRHDGTTAPGPAPAAPRPSKYTLLLGQDDALALDELALDLRRRTGRPVDKSEIIRALIRLADTSPPVTAALGKALDRR